MKLNKQALIRDLIPILRRNVGLDKVKKEVISYLTQENIVDLTDAIYFVNGNFNYLAEEDDQLIRLIQGLLHIYDLYDVPYNLKLENYILSEEKIQPSVSYNTITITNVAQISTTAYVVSVDGEYIYKLFNQDLFDLQYLASIPEMRLNIDMPDKMLTAGNELKVNRLVKDLLDNLNIPVALQFNVSPTNGEFVYDTNGTLTIRDAELEIIDASTFYMIYAISKITNQKARLNIPIYCSIYAMNTAELDEYRRRCAYQLSINAKYFEVQQKESPTISAIKELISKPGMDNFISADGTKPIMAGDLSTYFNRHFEGKVDMTQIVDMFVAALRYIYTVKKNYYERKWPFKKEIILCRTVDMLWRKGIKADQPSIIGECFVYMIEHRGDYNLRVTYRNVAESTFKEFDERLEEWLCSIKS